MISKCRTNDLIELFWIARQKYDNILTTKCSATVSQIQSYSGQSVIIIFGKLFGYSLIFNCFSSLWLSYNFIQWKTIEVLISKLFFKYCDRLAHWMWISNFQCYELTVCKWFCFNILCSQQKKKKSNFAIFYQKV